jgi:hypothetical protein
MKLTCMYVLQTVFTIYDLLDPLAMHFVCYVTMVCDMGKDSTFVLCYMHFFLYDHVALRRCMLLFCFAILENISNCRFL